MHSELPDEIDPCWLPGTRLAKTGPWSLLCDDREQETPITAAWKEAFVALFPTAVQILQDAFPLPDGVEANIILAGGQACIDWGMDEDSLGFQAIISRQPGSDGEGDILDLPNDHRGYVNLQAHHQAVLEDRLDGASIEAGLVTLAHEMAHVALFARYTNGKTPLEVFDASDEGERELSRILDEMEGEASGLGHASSHGASEDQVEAFASSLVDRWVSGNPSATTLIDAIIRQSAKPHRPRP